MILMSVDFAGAVVADKRDDLARVDVEREILDRHHAAEGLVDVLERQNGRASASGGLAFMAAPSGPARRPAEGVVNLFDDRFVLARAPRSPTT